MGLGIGDGYLYWWCWYLSGRVLCVVWGGFLWLNDFCDWVFGCWFGVYYYCGECFGVLWYCIIVICGEFIIGGGCGWWWFNCVD